MPSLPRNIKLDRSSLCFVIPLKGGKTFLATSYGSHQIWKIHSETGAMSVYAGTEEEGYSDGLSQYSSFSYPCGLALMQDGCVVVADCWNHSLSIAHGRSKWELQKELRRYAMMRTLDHLHRQVERSGELERQLCSIINKSRS